MNHQLAKRLVQAFTFIALVFCYGCLDQIQFDPPSEFQNSTVIMGKIVKGNPSSVEVTIQKVFDFSFTGENFVNAVSVQVVDESGKKLDIPQQQQGFYKLAILPSMDFEVEIGRSYGIEISLFDGQSFKSSLEELIPVPGMESVEHKLITKEVTTPDSITQNVTLVEYRVNTPLIADANQKRTNVKWDLLRTYKKTDLIARDVCYVSGFEESDLIQTFNTTGNTTSTINDRLLLEQVVTRIMVEGQYVSVIQESLNEGAMEFWDQVNGLSSNSGTFFEPPPGQVVTNIKKTNEVEGAIFGYFYATEHDTIHTFVDSTFVDFYTAICPHPDNVPRENSDFGPCDDCCFCLWTPNSTTEKPSFWTR